MTDVEVATEVVVSFPAVDDDTAGAIDTDSYRSYLRRAHEGPVAVGEEWAEFVNCGCGTTHDVVLRVEAVTGGDAIGEGTGIVFEARDG